MGRRKKNKNSDDILPKNNNQEGKKKIKLNMAGEAKRSAVAVFLFALALVMVLGFFGSAGMIGEKINKICGLLLGWAKFIFPAFLIMSGIILLIRQEKSFYVTRIIGLSLTLFSLVSFFHWFYGNEEMIEVAGNGLGGGYVGFALAYIFTKYL